VTGINSDAQKLSYSVSKLLDTIIQGDSSTSKGNDCV